MRINELEVCGVDPKRRGVRPMSRLKCKTLSGNSVTFSGREFSVADAVIKPKPRIPIPVLVGGRSDAALTRAAKFSEGWIGVWCSAKRFADAVDIVRDEAQAEGRSQVDWCHGYQPWVGVDLKSSKTFGAVKGYGTLLRCV